MAAGQDASQPGIFRFPGKLQFTPQPWLPVNPDVSLPLESSRAGDIFLDRFNPNLSWYLPGYQLATDIDASFSFNAGGETIDADSNPYYQATITLTVDKIEPPDVTAYRAANPAIQLQEIPLTGLTATLTTTAADPQSGQTQQSVYTAGVTTDASGNLGLSFGPIVGAQVLVAYYNLQSGGATVTVSAQFEVWRVGWIRRPIIFRPPIEVIRTPIVQAQTDQPEATSSPVSDPAFGPTRGITQIPVMPIRPVMPVFPVTPVRPIRPVFPVTPIPTPTPPVYVTATDPFLLAFDLGEKYAAPGYARSFTITDKNGVRPILSINDLKNFSTSGTEFSQFTVLGDIQSQFPSFSSLYIGAISRTIVGVPSAYGILRSKDGTAAQCQARVDSSATGNGSAEFQFAFVLGPMVSPFDFFALQAALASNPQSQGFTLVLPHRLDSSQPMTLSTPFQSSVTFTAGLQAGTFQLAVDITDGSVAGSSIPNANLILNQLSAKVQPYLSGSFGITLDDAYPHPVIANVVVNLSETSGSDEISYSIATGDGTIELINASPLDLQVSRYAIVTGKQAPPEILNQEILSLQTLTLSDKATSSSVSLLIDSTLALEDPFTKEALQRYVEFDVLSVQNINYQLGIVANGVNFAAMGIAEIDVVITIPSVPSVSVPNSTLTPLNLASNAQISMPLQNAISTLPGVIAFTVKSTDTKQADVHFTAQNDFIDNPVYVLQQSSIPPFAAS